MARPDFIPPPVRARLRELRLSSRKAAMGHGFGQHSSRSRGAGLEFAQYRAYEPGDEPRQIDWKLYARSDRFFVREAERDSPLTVWSLIDATASMGQGDAARPDWSRLDAARGIAACVIELALRQGDRFGLAMIGAQLDLVPAGSGPRQRDRCLLALQALQPGGHWPAETVLRPLWERVRGGDLALLLTDGLDEGSTVLAERLAAAQREVLAVQILTAEERDFPFRGGYRFQDPESGAELLTDAVAARAGFLQRFGAARAARATRLASAGVRHAEYVLDQPLDAPLRRFFALRAGQATLEDA